MMIRPGFSFLLHLMMATFLLGFPLENQAWKGPAKAIPMLMNRVSINGRPLTDPQGNFIGVTIPLKRAGRLLLFEGTVDGVIGNFILDTGSSGLVLNKTYFRNCMIIDDEEGGGVTGSTGVIARINVKRLLVAGLIYMNISADVTPLGHLENRRGVKILGLFGMSLLKNLEIVIDSRNNELQLYKLDKNGNRVGTPSAEVKFDITHKIEQYRNIMFVKVSIGGKLLDFCLDTGAESNVLSIDAPKQSLGTVTITRRSNLQGVGSDDGEVLFGTMNDFILGNKKFISMETILCSLKALSNKYGYPIDGMLGYDFFTTGKIYINLVKKEMGICFKTEVKP
jgi:predicted aspartyl protease